MTDAPNSVFPPPTENESSSAVDISMIRATKMSCFNVKESKDKEETFYISGMDLTSKGILLVTDWNNWKVKFFSEDNTLLTTFQMSEELYDIAVIDDNEAVVSTVDKKLHFLDISALPMVTFRSSLLLAYMATNMTSCSGNIVLVCQLTDPASLKMIDKNGKEIWSLTTGPGNQQLFEKPYGVETAKFNGTNAVFVTDWKRETLTVVNASNGTVLKIMDLKDKTPHGLSINGDGTIFICSKNTHEILVVSIDLTQSQVLMKDQNIQEYPMNMVHRRSTGELYVAYGQNYEIDRFKLSMATE